MKFGIWFWILFCFQVDLKIQHLLCSSGFLLGKKSKRIVCSHWCLIMFMDICILSCELNFYFYLVLFFMSTELILQDCFALGYLFRGVYNKVAEFFDDCGIRSAKYFWSGILLFENFSGNMLCLEAGTAWIISFRCCTWLSSFSFFPSRVSYIVIWGLDLL